MTTELIETPGKLLDYVKDNCLLASDAALARFLKVPAPVISNMRSGRLKFGASYIIRLHELTGWSVASIKSHLPTKE
jgi:Predicted transcriptional regulator